MEEEMLAAQFDRFSGDFSSLICAEVPDPVLDAGEVLVKIQTASVSPSDAKNVQGHMEGTTLPRIPGRDFAGIVVAGEPSLIGTEVWGTGGDIGFTRDGSHAQFLRLPAKGVARKPKNLAVEQAAASGVNLVTAYSGLKAARLHAADVVLVIGATGGVGSAVVQLALWKGARVIGVVRSLRGLPEGVPGVVSSTLEETASAIRRAAPAGGVSLVFDTVGGEFFELGLKTLAHRGRQVNISSTGSRRVSFDLIDFYHREAHLMGVDSRALDAAASAAILEELAEPIEKGRVSTPQIGLKFPLKQVVEAYKSVASGSARGKVILEMPR
jgi:NADPH:quinone reductase